MSFPSAAIALATLLNHDSHASAAELLIAYIARYYKPGKAQSHYQLYICDSSFKSAKILTSHR